MTLYIPLLVYCQIKDFVELCDLEISGLGKISKYKDGFLVEKVKLLEQEVSGANTKMDAVGLGKLYHEIIQEEGSLAGWKLWWHSHADMSTFWSGKDIETIDDFDNETPNNNWWLSVVFNHKMDWKARLDVYAPTHITINLDYLKVEQIYSQAIREDCRLQIAQKVREIKVNYKKDDPVELPLDIPLTKEFFKKILPELRKKSTTYNAPLDVL